MLVKRLTPLPCEAVVRGYVVGSGWKEYTQSGTVCGIANPSIVEDFSDDLKMICALGIAPTKARRA